MPILQHRYWVHMCTSDSVFFSVCLYCSESCSMKYRRELLLKNPPLGPDPPGEGAALQLSGRSGKCSMASGSSVRWKPRTQSLVAAVRLPVELREAAASHHWLLSLCFQITRVNCPEDGTGSTSSRSVPAGQLLFTAAVLANALQPHHRLIDQRRLECMRDGRSSHSRH